MFDEVINYIRGLYPEKKNIALHEPLFIGNEKKYVMDAIDSNFVSSVGQYVDLFEKRFAEHIGAKKAVVTGNGTSALHAGLWLLNVRPGDEVITQALTFVATANAIAYCGAAPIFVDSDRETLGMSPDSLEEFLKAHAVVEGNVCRNRKTGKLIKACVPVHVFGHPVKIKKIIEICEKYAISVLEDAAESLGSLQDGVHTGLYGKIGVFSFNGNKIMTSGGGGVIVTQDLDLGVRAKHLTTTAKIPHAWEFDHDELGFNYRMPNLNAALALGQLEKLDEFVANKRETAQLYKSFFEKKGIEFITEPVGARSNYWLNAIILSNRNERDSFLEQTNKQGVMTRPVWKLMSDLVMYKDCQKDSLSMARDISNRLVNIPSSVRINL